MTDPTNESTFGDGSRTSVFLSYSTGDRGIADVARDSAAGLGVATWVDRFQIRAGRQWQNDIDRAIGSADFLVVLVSPLSLSSPNVRHELAQAKAEGCPRIGVLVADIVTPQDLDGLLDQLIDLRIDPCDPSRWTTVFELGSPHPGHIDHHGSELVRSVVPDFVTSFVSRYGRRALLRRWPVIAVFAVLYLFQLVSPPPGGTQYSLSHVVHLLWLPFLFLLSRRIDQRLTARLIPQNSVVFALTAPCISVIPVAYAYILFSFANKSSQVGRIFDLVVLIPIFYCMLAIGAIYGLDAMVRRTGRASAENPLATVARIARALANQIGPRVVGAARWACRQYLQAPVDEPLLRPNATSLRKWLPAYLVDVKSRHRVGQQRDRSERRYTNEVEQEGSERPSCLLFTAPADLPVALFAAEQMTSAWVMNSAGVDRVDDVRRVAIVSRRSVDLPSMQRLASAADVTVLTVGAPHLIATAADRHVVALDRLDRETTMNAAMGVPTPEVEDLRAEPFRVHRRVVRLALTATAFALVAMSIAEGSRGQMVWPWFCPLVLATLPLAVATAVRRLPAASVAVVIASTAVPVMAFVVINPEGVSTSPGLAALVFLAVLGRVLARSSHDVFMLQRSCRRLRNGQPIIWQGRIKSTLAIWCPWERFHLAAPSLAVATSIVASAGLWRHRSELRAAHATFDPTVVRDMLTSPQMLFPAGFAILWASDRFGLWRATRAGSRQ